MVGVSVNCIITGGSVSNTVLGLAVGALGGTGVGVG